MNGSTHPPPHWRCPIFHVYLQVKDAAEAKATYAKAKEALVVYLKGTKLEPIGDPIYNQ